MYSLDYSATCKSMQMEQTVQCYLDWVDQELNHCGKQLRRFAGKWQDFILPGKIKRNIKSEGYVSGQYRLTLDQDKILELLIGKDLYSDPSVFVRELIQNAIDAVRTREQLDKNLPRNWKGKINIRCWMDQEGYHWFRIEDNGIGMTEDVIMNYLLKIGSSYYSSDTFLKSKLQCNADPAYMPISRFGIGILSCFMGDDQTNQVEISTKHFNEGNVYYPSLRLSMHGINGYYYLSNKDKKHMPGPMKGVTQKEKAPYLTQAGTVVAVRTNLYRAGKYRSFKEIVDKYVIYPPVAVHYDGEEGSYDYLTEENFMDAVDSIHPSDHLREKGLMEFAVSDEDLNKLYSEIPQIYFKKPPKLVLKCFSLKDYTSTPFLKGALLTVKMEGEHAPINLRLGNKNVRANVDVGLNINEKRDKLGIRIKIVFDRNFKQQIEELKRKYSSLVNRRNDLENSEKELKETTNEVTEFIRRNGYFRKEEDDVATLKAFRVLQKKWVFEACVLSEFEWYNKYFKNIRNNTGLYSAAAHNGILCGDAGFFFRNNDVTNLVAILLFKDKYRPYLDVARDGVHGFTLETASEIEIIKKSLTKQDFQIDGNFSKLREENYSYIVMADYCKLLDERDDLAKKLVFQTREGLLSNERLAGELSKKGKIEYYSCPRISNRSDWSKNEYLYEYLSAAFLRENYLLQIDFTPYNRKVYISKRQKEVSEDYKKLFPACFFLPELNQNGSILTAKALFRRYACNEYHKLSQFILKNGMELNKNVPGIFKELLRILAEEEEDDLIHKVNNLLGYLSKFQGGLFEISEDLFLSKKDLI